MGISQDTINKIKEAVDIVEVIEEFVQLKKKGQNWMGLSPFNNEKTPSFSVSPSRGIFKDFSSGKGGDAIAFLMEHEGISYVEALKYLAKKYVIEIEEDSFSEDQQMADSERDSIFIALNFAKNYFQRILTESEKGKSIGLSYFKERGFRGTTIEKFELGFATDGWQDFLDEAKRNQFSEEILEKAGLIIVKDEKKYDRFRDRVIFPIHNSIGKTIGFGARTLSSDKSQPKYINSPETEVYNKSQELYGFYFAKNAIRNKNAAILVEGYTDVISLHQAGVEHVVASSGTSLTDQQIKLVKRFSNNIIFVFDGDAAGIRASLRGVDMVLKTGMHVMVLILPDGNDPDSFIKTNGGEAFEKYIEAEKKDFLTFKTELRLKDAKQDPFLRAEVIRDIVSSIALIPDPITRSVYFKECSRMMDVSEDLLIAEFNKIILTERKKLRQEETIVGKEKIKTRETQDNETANPLERDSISDLLKKKEGELIRILIKYSNIQIDEEGEVQKLGNILLDGISDVEFMNDEFNEILAIYKQFVEKQEFPEVDDFLNNDIFEQYRGLVIDLISERYSPSDNWVNHNIHIPTEEESLSEKLFKDIFRLKWQKVKELKHNNQQKILELQADFASNEGEIMKLISNQSELKRLEKEITEFLGNVISG